MGQRHAADDEDRRPHLLQLGPEAGPGRGCDPRDRAGAGNQAGTRRKPRGKRLRAPRAARDRSAAAQRRWWGAAVPPQGSGRHSGLVSRRARRHVPRDGRRFRDHFRLPLALAPGRGEEEAPGRAQPRPCRRHLHARHVHPRARPARARAAGARREAVRHLQELARHAARRHERPARHRRAVVHVRPLEPQHEQGAEVVSGSGTRRSAEGNSGRCGRQVAVGRRIPNSCGRHLQAGRSDGHLRWRQQPVRPFRARGAGGARRDRRRGRARSGRGAVAHAAGAGAGPLRTRRRRRGRGLARRVGSGAARSRRGPRPAVRRFRHRRRGPHRPRYRRVRNLRRAADDRGPHQPDLRNRFPAGEPACRRRRHSHGRRRRGEGRNFRGDSRGGGVRLRPTATFSNRRRGPSAKRRASAATRRSPSTCSAP